MSGRDGVVARSSRATGPGSARPRGTAATARRWAGGGRQAVDREERAREQEERRQTRSGRSPRTCRASAGSPRRRRSARRRPGRSGRPWECRGSTSGDATAPNSQTTTMKIAATSVEPEGDPGERPEATSRGPIGVAYMAWKSPAPAMPSMIGKVASKIACCIAVAGQEARRQEQEVRSRRRRRRGSWR